MANTEQIEAKLCAYVDGDLDAAARAEIEQHLSANPQHRELLAELMEQRNLLRDLPREKAPDDLFDSFQTQLERSVLLDANRAPTGGIHRNRWSQMVALAAIFVLAVGLAAVIFFVLPDKSKTLKNYAVLTPATTPSGAESPGGSRLADASKATPTTLDLAPSRTLTAAADHRAGDHRADMLEKSAIGPDQAAIDKHVALAPATQNNLALHASKSDMERSPAVDTFAGGQALPMPLEPDIANRVKQMSQVPANSMVLVVATANPTATDHEVTSYLAMNNLRWDEVPANAPQATPQPAPPAAATVAENGEPSPAKAEATPTRNIAPGREAAASLDRKDKVISQKAAALNSGLAQSAQIPTSQPTIAAGQKDLEANQQVAASTPANSSLGGSTIELQQQKLESGQMAAPQMKQQAQQNTQASVGPSRYIVARGLTQSQVAELNMCIAAQNTGSIANYRRSNDTITPTTLPIALAMQQSAPSTQPAAQITFDGESLNGAVGGGGSARQRLDFNLSTAPATQPASPSAPSTSPAKLQVGAATSRPTLTPADVAAGALASIPLPPPTRVSVPTTASALSGGATSQPTIAAGKKESPTTAPVHVATTAPVSAPTTAPTTSLAEDRVDVVIVVQPTPTDQPGQINAAAVVRSATAASAPTAVQAATPTDSPVKTATTAPAATQAAPAPVLKARRP